MVDWYYIFSILALGVYPCSPDIYNVVLIPTNTSKQNWFLTNTNKVYIRIDDWTPAYGSEGFRKYR
jgi:hypothetical protein